MGIIPSQEISWKITLDMVLLSLLGTDYYNVFHFTIGQNIGRLGDRTPALWIFQQRLLFGFNAGSYNQYFSPIIIPLNQKMRVVIEQIVQSNKPIVRIFIDKIMVHQAAHNWQIPFKNVKFYLGDPWYPPASVKILYFNYEELQLL